MQFFYRISFFVNSDLEDIYTKKYLYTLIHDLNLIFTPIKLKFMIKNILYDKFMHEFYANKKNSINLLHKLTKKYKNKSNKNENIIFFIGKRKNGSRVKGLVYIGNAYNLNNNFGLLFHSNNFLLSLIHEILHSLNIFHKNKTIMNKYDLKNTDNLDSEIIANINEYLNDNCSYFT